MVNPAEGAEVAEDEAAEGRSGERVAEEWRWRRYQVGFGEVPVKL